MALSVSPLFLNGCVLQRGDKTKIWGNAVPFEAVYVEFIGVQYKAYASADGAWEVSFGDLAPGGAHRILVQSKEERLVVDDVLIGDVWVCGGQSNMEMTMWDVRHLYADTVDENENTFIRQFSVPEWYDFTKPCANVGGMFSDECKWSPVNAETVPDFTAVGYFFAKKLYERYEIPIGIIKTAVGGTPIHAWMGSDMLADCPAELKEANLYANSAFVEQSSRAYEKSMTEQTEALNKKDEGFLETWYAKEYDDTNWDERELCVPWDDGLRQSGVIWFRKTIEIPEKIDDKPATMFLGAVADADTVYVNGEVLGETDNKYTLREYNITSLKAGPCVIAIRVRNFYGSGGFVPDKPYFISCGRNTIQLDGIWKYRRAASCDNFPKPFNIITKPTGLFNGMIAPLTRYAIKGITWYQGESDDASPDGYGEKFINLINGWRKWWGLGNILFIFAELTYWAQGSNWDYLRKQQKSALALQNTAMVRTIDVGEYNDLHPLNKETIGYRMAQATMENPPASPFILYGGLTIVGEG